MAAKGPGFQKPRLIPKDHLAAIGSIACLWTAVEIYMELTILGLYEIDMGRGLVLTNNLTFQSRMSLLRILAGEKTEKLMTAAQAEELGKILGRVEDAYNDRNIVVHALWDHADKPGFVRRRTIRARGKKLQTVTQDYSAADLRAIADRIDVLLKDFADLTVRMGVDLRLAAAPKHSTQR